jgi:hypothetical protein
LIFFFSKEKHLFSCLSGTCGVTSVLWCLLYFILKI